MGGWHDKVATSGPLQDICLYSVKQRVCLRLHWEIQGWKSLFILEKLLCGYHPYCRQQGWKVCVVMQGNSIAAHQRGPKRSLGGPQERWNCVVWLVHMHCSHECNMQPHNCIALQGGICIHPWCYRSIMYIKSLADGMYQLGEMCSQER